MPEDFKHPLKWFEARVGDFIYRPPIFAHESKQPYVAMKIKDKKHALLLYDLQRPGRPRYESQPGNDPY